MLASLLESAGLLRPETMVATGPHFSSPGDARAAVLPALRPLARRVLFATSIGTCRIIPGRTSEVDARRAQPYRVRSRHVINSGVGLSAQSRRSGRLADRLS